MARESKYTKELLGPVVQSSVSMLEVLRKLGLRQTGGNFSHIQARVRYVGLSTSHFTGRLWAKGKTREEDSRIGRPGLSDEDVFVENSRPINGVNLTRRLIRLGWDYKCFTCGIDEWRGDPLALHLDHISGIRNDNRKKNLRWLCPNCHQQTKTWGGKNNRGM